MDTADTVIVGGGIAGLATAWALAESGAQGVVVVERDASCGRHSSGLNAAILRSAIDSPATRALARSTAAALSDLPASLRQHSPGPLMDGRGLVVCEGTIDLPEPRWLADALADGARGLSKGELDQLVPGFVPEGERQWWFPQLGRIDREGLLACLQAASQALGVRILTNAEVVGIPIDQSGQARGVNLAQGGSIAAERVVLAPGGWAAKLAQTCGARFPGRPTRRHLFVSSPAPAVSPDQPIVWDDAAGFYALPDSEGLMLCLCDEEDTDPDACFPDPLIERRLRRRLAASLPSLSQLAIERSWCAMRTLSEDDHPVVGEDPQVGGLWWVGALGGHGMSISLGLGRTAAALLLGQQVDPTIAGLLAPASAAREYSPTRDW